MLCNGQEEVPVAKQADLVGDHFNMRDPLVWLGRNEHLFRLFLNASSPEDPTCRSS